MSVSKEDISRAKGQGFLLNRGQDTFSGRIVSAGGVYTSTQLAQIAKCAEQFGNGKVVFTSRLSAEVPGLKLIDLPTAAAFLAEADLSFGGTGPKVRPVTACKGTTCVYGNIDTQKLAHDLHERFYIGMHDTRLPHKFKIGIGGCPNSCMKPSLNDIGIEGHALFEFDAGACKGCKSCSIATSCPSKAVQKNGEKMEIDATKCMQCGVCVGKCPFGAMPSKAESLCRIYIGGTWGRKWRIGESLKATYTVDEVPDIVEKAILWYRENGYSGERFGLTVDRIGISAFESDISSNDLLNRKSEILAAPIKQKP